MHRSGVFTLLLVTALLKGCSIAPAPLATLNYAAPTDTDSSVYTERRLLVFLRGIGGSAEDFANYGLVAAAQERYPNMDVWVPNAHFGYYYKRSLLERLQEDIITRARERGYKRIDFAGVSMGGFGSLLYLQCCQETIDKVVLISPYSGERETHASIAEAEDLSSWVAPEDIEDYEVDLWNWIANSDPLFQSGRLWLGYGDDDYLSGHDLLARQLPEDQVLVVEGEHTAEVFTEIWQQILDKGALD